VEGKKFKGGRSSSAYDGKYGRKGKASKKLDPDLKVLQTEDLEGEGTNTDRVGVTVCLLKKENAGGGGKQ